jgi:hypothetical protein
MTNVTNVAGTAHGHSTGHVLHGNGCHQQKGVMLSGLLLAVMRVAAPHAWQPIHGLQISFAWADAAFDDWKPQQQHPQQQPRLH